MRWIAAATPSTDTEEEPVATTDAWDSTRSERVRPVGMTRAKWSFQKLIKARLHAASRRAKRRRVVGVSAHADRFKIDECSSAKEES